MWHTSARAAVQVEFELGAMSDILVPFTEALDVEIRELRKNVSNQYGLPNEPRDCIPFTHQDFEREILTFHF